MVNEDFRPSVLASARRMRTHIEWNVDTHMARARGPTSWATRSFISPAALFVNVMARISPGCAPRWASRWATRYVSTRVLPDPAPPRLLGGLHGRKLDLAAAHVRTSVRPRPTVFGPATGVPARLLVFGPCR